MNDDDGRTLAEKDLLLGVLAAIAVMMFVTGIVLVLTST